MSASSSNPIHPLRLVNVEESLTCSICLEETQQGLSHEEGKITHIFHEACLANLSFCPNCRVPINRPISQCVPASSETSSEDNFISTLSPEEQCKELLKILREMRLEREEQFRLAMEGSSFIASPTIFTPDPMTDEQIRRAIVTQSVDLSDEHTTKQLPNDGEERIYMDELSDTRHILQIDSTGLFTGYRQIQIHGNLTTQSTLGYLL